MYPLKHLLLLALNSEIASRTSIHLDDINIILVNLGVAIGGSCITVHDEVIDYINPTIPSFIIFSLSQ